jgi:hypothetical protein
MSVFSGGFSNYTPLINTITTELQTIQGLIDPSGSIDLSGVYSRQDLGNTILADICNGIGALDISVSFVETNEILTDICNQVGSINGLLQAKSFQVVQLGTPAPLPFQTNFIKVPCVIKKVICETSQSSNSDTGFAITTFYDTSSNPTGTQPIVLRLLHPSNNVNPNPSLSVPEVSFGTSFHDIMMPDGGLSLSSGLGIICSSGTGNVSLNGVALTIYYTT